MYFLLTGLCKQYFASDNLRSILDLEVQINMWELV